MDKQVWGARITGIGIATKGLRLVRNSDIKKMLLDREREIVNWLQSEAALSWWNSENSSAGAARFEFSRAFEKLMGRPINFSIVPDRLILWNQVIRKQIKTNHRWIVSHTGIHERYFAEDGVATSDLACDAIIQALKIAGREPSDVDGLFLATVSDDYNQTPPTTALIIDRLQLGKNGEEKLSDFPFNDITEACCSFLAALRTAYLYIRSGSCKTVIVVGADKMSGTVSRYSRNIFPILADGGGAIVLERCPAEEDAFSPRSFFSTSDGSLASLIITPAGGSKQPITASMINNPFDQSHLMLMNGPEVMKRAVNILLPSSFGRWASALIPAGLNNAGFQIKTERDLKRALQAHDLIVPHQANRRITRKLEERARNFGFRGNCCSNIERYGNTTSAAIPILLHDLWRRGKLRPIKRGSKTSFKRIMSVAFGGGFTGLFASFLWTVDSPS